MCEYLCSNSKPKKKKKISSRLTYAIPHAHCNIAVGGGGGYNYFASARINSTHINNVFIYCFDRRSCGFPSKLMWVGNIYID